MRLRGAERAWVAAVVASSILLAEWPARSAPAAAGAPTAKPATRTPKPATGTIQTGAGSAANPVVATIGTRKVLRSEFDSRTDRARRDFRAHYGTDVPEEMDILFRRQVLSGMINLNLLVLEAQRRGITATVAEADEILKRNPFFNPGGKFDAEKFAAAKAANSPTYQSTIQELRLEIAGSKLQAQLQAQHTPSDSLLREVAIRSLGQADLDYFLVDARAFDGHYPEPRETEILDYYRAHASEFRQAERAVLSVIFVDTPGISDSARTAPGALKAWDARLRARADSALTALRKGSAFEQVAAHFSGQRTGEVVLANNFPGYWQGTPQQQAEVFRSAPGTWLAQPVASHPGYLVVRVDSTAAAGLTPLAEVSSEIRRRLRSEARLHREDREFAGLYARYADSLSSTAVRVRYASADTAAMDTGEPTEADLDRYFRGHLADYSTYDTKTSSIRSYTLDDVRDDVRRRWRYDRRAEMARVLAEQLTRTWSAGKRDPALEKQATLLREVGPVPIGAALDTGLVARIVADSLRFRGPVTGTGTSGYARGFLVFSVYEVIPRYKPTLDQARPQLRVIEENQRADQDRAGAKAMFERNPDAWKRGQVQHFSRFLVPQLQPIDVPLTRAEIVRYRKEHAADYSAPELMHARHILISPTGPGEEADRIAHARADSILKVIRHGADFSNVARQVTDDPATQAAGGDLGTFGHGAMLPTFEKAAFKLRAGQISDPVRTREGYHLIQCVEYWPLEERPLAWIYSQVGFDCAHDKADSLCHQRADSLYRSLRSPEQAAATARKFGWPIDHNQHVIGDHSATADLKPYLIALESVKPGTLYPGVQLIRGFGYVITWVDSIAAPATPKWEEVSDRVLDVYRRDASARAVTAKLAELDSLAARGWSFDSLAALWGGKVAERGLKPSDGLRDMNNTRAPLDSLVYGTRLGPGLKPGEVSGWTRVPYGYIRLRLLNRVDPSETDIRRRMDADRNASQERSMKPVFDEMATRYSVRILDPEMKAAIVPALPPGPPGLP